jgi:WD40 repeat protein
MLRSYSAGLAVVVMAVWCFSGSSAEEERGPVQGRGTQFFASPTRHVGVYGFSADGRLLLLSTGAKRFPLMDTATGKEIASFGWEDEPGATCALSPDGKTVAACFGKVTEIILFDVASGKPLHRLPHPERVSSMAFSPDGKMLISIGHDLSGHASTVRRWEIATGKELSRFQIQLIGNLLGGGKFSPDGKTVGVGVEDGSVHIIDAATGRELRRLFHPDNRVHGVQPWAFSPDGKHVAVYGEEADGSVIRMWEVSTGKLVQAFRRPRMDIHDIRKVDTEMRMRLRMRNYWSSDNLAFSPDGKTLAEAARDRTQLWEVATGALRYQFSGSAASMMFSPDGAVLVTGGGEGGFVNFWDWRDAGPECRKPLDSKGVEQTWVDLSASDSAVGHRAIAALIASPRDALKLLGDRLQRVEPVTLKQLDQLIVDLDDDSFDVRERASQRLAELGEVARGVLRRAAEKQASPEVKRRVADLLTRLDGPPPPDLLRGLRAVEVLESIGGEKAQAQLDKLAGGAAGVPQTEDSRAALQRLAQKK